MGAKNRGFYGRGLVVDKSALTKIRGYYNSEVARILWARIGNR